MLPSYFENVFIFEVVFIFAVVLLCEVVFNFKAVFIVKIRLSYKEACRFNVIFIFVNKQKTFASAPI